jgi:hypothetical protein
MRAAVQDQISPDKSGNSIGHLLGSILGATGTDRAGVRGESSTDCLISPAAGNLIRATVVLTNGFNGMSIIPELIGQSIPGPHPVFGWLGYPVFRR